MCSNVILFLTKWLNFEFTRVQISNTHPGKKFFSFFFFLLYYGHGIFLQMSAPEFDTVRVLFPPFDKYGEEFIDLDFFFP